jgi:hypothetical protein
MHALVGRAPPRIRPVVLVIDAAMFNVYVRLNPLPFSH